MILYLDTSVLSALFDTRNPERVGITREFFVARISDRLLVSELTLAEIAATPSEALRNAMSELADRCEIVAVVTDADQLASRYIEAGAVSEAFSADAYHIAIAVAYGADVVVSWNFRHIVRRKTRDVVNMVNTMHGYAHIEIAAPGELL
ncbi:MAG: PIN domain-containing protein [Spirochaetia bacterium]